MKLTVFLLLVSVAGTLAGKSYSQTKMINLNLGEVTVKEALKDIEEQSGFHFLYSENLVNVERKVNLTIENKKIEQVLKLIFEGTDVDYSIRDRFIVLTSPGMSTGELQLAQQQKDISGKVTDSSGAPLPGVTVVIKGTTKGTITDGDGNYSLSNVPGDGSLVFSFLGMRSQEILVDGSTHINITMSEETIGLEEVVAVGYGSMKRKEITGSVTNIAMDQMPSANSMSVAQMLGGRAAGLSASLTSAQPGAKTKLQIRGSATGREPLIVIDGFPVSNFSDAGAGPYGKGETDAILASLNPDDIASIDILKDASSTSVYGTRAAGGVILITTRKGKSGKASASFNSNVGFSKIYGLPNMLGPTEYMNAVNNTQKEIYMYNNNIGVYGGNPESMLENFTPQFQELDFADWKGKQGTNWMKAISRTAVVQNYGANIQGGSETSQYYASLGHAGQEGVIKTNNYKKYTGLFNIDQKFGNKIKLNLNMTASRIDIDNVALQEGYGGQSDIIRTALSFPTNLAIKDEEGKFTSNPLLVDMDNPVSFLDMKNSTRTDRLMGHASLSYEIINGLTVQGMVGFDYTSSQGYSYLPKSTRLGANANGLAERSLNEKNDYQTQLKVNYNKKFKEKHYLNMMVGTEFMSMNRAGFKAGNRNFMTDSFLWNNLGLGASASPTVGSWASKTETLSYILRGNYSFNERYFITASLRIDGSSNFAKNNQWGYFPGISAGWDIAGESFMENTRKVIDNLKFRVGYGQTGNDNIGSVLNDYYAAGDKILIGNTLYASTRLGGFGNPDLKWETQTDFNVGVDFSFWNGRLYGSVEYFNRVITDLLGYRSLSSASELTEIVANLDAKKQTYGYEMTLNSRNITTQNFSWNTTATFTYYRDRWLKRDRNWVPDITDSPKAYFGELWYYESGGVVQPGETLSYTDKPIPGTVKIKDRDGYLLDENGNKVLDSNRVPKRLGHPDGKIDNADKKLMGVNTPYTIGLTNNLKYKKFDLNISAYGVFNRWMNNSTLQMLTNVNDLKLGNNIMKKGLNCWSSENQQGYYPSANQSSSSFGVGDFFLEKAWYIRISNIDLGYTLPLKNHSISHLRVYTSLGNPFLFTPYKGLDPETDGREASYPNSRTYSIGLQLNF